LLWFGLDPDRAARPPAVRRDRYSRPIPTLALQTVWLPDLVRENPWIEGYTFEYCTLVGPMAIVPGEGAVLEDSGFDGSSLDAVLVTVPDGVRITWAAGLRHSTIRNCRLQGIALVGTAEAVERWRVGFKDHP
jgi:hypothetical protein